MTTTIPLLAIDLPSPRGHAPLRQPFSIRRTSSIDVTWPDGPDHNLHFHGVGRDVFTPAAGGAPTVLTTDELFAELSPDRVIQKIRAEPARAGIDALIGVRGGGHLRRALNDALPMEQENGSPLYLLIDDLSGASLVSSWALYSTGAVPLPDLGSEQRQGMLADREGVCIGFRPGSSALEMGDDTGPAQNSARVMPLHHPDDPDGWHPLNYGTILSFRRARRIDVWRDGDIHIDATFQDSAAQPDGGRQAVHEYSLKVTADADTLRIKTIAATPHILPFAECPNAIESLDRMVDKPLADMRLAVLEEFPKVKGCTHLNDCMRSIAEVPKMVAELLKRG